MRRQSRFIIVYLSFAFILGIVGLINSLLSISKMNLVFLENVYSIAMLFFSLFSLRLLVFLKHKKYPKIYYALPAYYIFITLFTIFASFFIFSMENISNKVFYGFEILGIITSLLEISMCIYLLRMLQSKEEDHISSGASMPSSAKPFERT